MSFKDRSYKEKRDFRYSLQDYMHKVIRFGDYEGKRILEIGCGSGIDSVEFLRYEAEEVISLDWTKSSVSMTKQLLEESHQKGCIIQADASHLPFNSNSFDVVYSFGVLHHIPDIEAVIKDIHRILRVDGILLTMFYNRNSLLYSYSILNRGINEGLKPEESILKYSERNKGVPFSKAYMKEELLALLSPYFQRVDITPCYNVIDLPDRRKIKFSLENGINELGWHLIVKAVGKNVI